MSQNDLPKTQQNAIIRNIREHQRQQMKSEDQLQREMFMQLDAEGKLRTKQMGAAINLMRANQCLCRVIYINRQDAEAIARYMNNYFQKNAMIGWVAGVIDVELH